MHMHPQTLSLVLGLALLSACSGTPADGAPAGTGAGAPAGAAAKNTGGGGGGGGSGGPGGGGRGGGAGVTVAATDVATIARGTIEDAIAISGDLRPIETIEVRARLAGDIQQVYVREGERVRAGQILARFEASQQESQRRGATASRESAEAQLSTATWAAEQSAALFRAGAIAEQEYRNAQQAVVAARATVAAADAQVRAASMAATDTRVLAPSSGIIERRIVQPGERVAPTAPLFTLVRNEVLELAASVPARLADKVRPGQSVTLTAQSRALTATVTRVSPTIDPQSRSITAFVRIPNGNGALKGNTFASGRVIGQKRTDVTLVPTAAIRQTSGSDAQPFVWRIAGGTLEKRGLRLGIVDDASGVAEVLEGLAPGDRVISGNVGALGAGQKVTVAGGRA
jgi:membrane fusion protein, multidrug efflux system